VRAKSASRISGLAPVVQRAASELIDRCYAAGVQIVIVQGLRTYAEQAALYAQGRTTPGPIVTQAQAGHSNHNFGYALDFALLTNDGRSVSWDTKLDGDRDGRSDWNEVAEIGKDLGFKWGGDWTSFVDMPHLEMTFGISTAQFRAGKRPTEQQLIAALAQIERDEEMTAAEKKAFADLTATVESLKAQLAAAADPKEVPAWAKASVKKAIAKGVISDSKGTHDFYRLVVILDRAGTFN
jgi:peptidoglycan LD-endopeptidase CwlK